MIEKYLDKEPMVPESCFIHKLATIAGGVKFGERCSVWPNASLRGDSCNITFGDNCNVQDSVVVHGYDEVVFGDYVSLGHGCIIHGANIDDNVIIGMGAIVLDGAKIGKNCIVGAGSLVTSNKVFGDGLLIVGSPAKAVRKLTEDEIRGIIENAEEYMVFLENYKIESMKKACK
ncbi:gamma carbonic anhydrase family protein [Peptostreptococcus porci]|uniref:gamma carbonic anhydrase family protein n=1 Tax=Peptostreptococcus porci TaxID=2652282 RepID=UPI002A913017|nr:gamma carbonic anhydrase family protein [Peptostreptococcus porci]MDY5435473.1 gamma carbonic anhydrase family protein [Peptostreptococcus porci]